MKIIVTEEQYDLLMKENIFKDTLKDLKLNTGILFTFGMGMGAFMGPVHSMLTGSGFEFSNEEIKLLIITSFAVLMNKSNRNELLEKVRVKNLDVALPSVQELISKTTDIIRSTIKNVLGISYSLSDILGFAFLLTPVMEIVRNIINDRGITSDNIEMLSSGVVLSALVFTIKNLIDKFKDMLGRKKISESLINEENYVELPEDAIIDLTNSLNEMGFEGEDAEYELNSIIEFYKNLPDELILYRVLFSDSQESIDLQYPGSHYCMDKNHLIESHYISLRSSSYGEKAYMVTVKAQKQLVDYYESINNNILYPNEKEITLKNNGFGAEIIEVGPVFS